MNFATLLRENGDTIRRRMRDAIVSSASHPDRLYILYVHAQTGHALVRYSLWPHQTGSAHPGPSWHCVFSHTFRGVPYSSLDVLLGWALCNVEQNYVDIVETFESRPPLDAVMELVMSSTAYSYLTAPRKD